MQHQVIHILMILASRGPQVGGMEKQVAILARHLAARDDYRVTVLADPSYQALFPAAVKFIAFNARRSRRNPLLWLELIPQIRQLNPDIVHTHGHKASQIIASIKRHIGHRTLIASAHGTKHNNTALASMDGIISVSNSVQAIIPYPSIVVPNAVERYDGPSYTKPALCQRFRLNSQQPLFVAMGRLAPVKNYGMLMQALAGLPANLLIFGEGPEYASLKQFEQDNVKLAGHTAHAQGIIAASDALLISSLREGFSLSMIEALQLNTPVLSTAVSGAKGLLPESCLIRNDTVDNMHHDIAAQLPKLEQLAISLESAFNFAQQQCTPEQLVALLHKHYHKCLARPKHPIS